MGTQSPEIDEVVERLDRLENQNLRMRRAGAAALVLVAAVFLLGQAAPTRTVEAEKLILREAGGKTRGTFSVADDGSMGLSFLDKDGMTRATLGVSADGSSRLRLNGKDEKPRAQLVVWADDSPHLSLTDATGKPVYKAPKE